MGPITEIRIGMLKNMQTNRTNLQAEIDHKQAALINLDSCIAALEAELGVSASDE